MGNLVTDPRHLSAVRDRQAAIDEHKKQKLVTKSWIKDQIINQAKLNGVLIAKTEKAEDDVEEKTDAKNKSRKTLCKEINNMGKIFFAKSEISNQVAKDLKTLTNNSTVFKNSFV